MPGLWNVIDGEPWLMNPSLIIGNPARRKGSFALDEELDGRWSVVDPNVRDPEEDWRVRGPFSTKREAGKVLTDLRNRWRKRKRGIMAKSYRRKRRGRKGTSRRRRVHRKNYAASGLIANPRRRRRRARRPYTAGRGRIRRYKLNARRRHYRRNPGALNIYGIQLPPLDAILFTGAGIVIPPVMTSFLMSYLPADWKTSKMAWYGVKVASVLIPSLLVRKFVSQRAGNFMLVGGAASFAIDLVREFAPGLLPGAAMSGQPFLGFYERMPNRALSGMGRYASIPVGSRSVQRTPLLSATPERLMPNNRF